MTLAGGVAHGDAGAQRCHAHGPPTRPGTMPCVNDRPSSSPVIATSKLHRFWSTTIRYTPIHATVSARQASHRRSPRRQTSRTPNDPVTYPSRATTANATNGITAAFSKNSSPPKYTTTPATA